MVKVKMTVERDAEEVSVELGHLNEARKALEGLALIGDEWAKFRLDQVSAAIVKRREALRKSAGAGRAEERRLGDNEQC